jgi:hypothetical protein
MSFHASYHHILVMRPLYRAVRFVLQSTVFCTLSLRSPIVASTEYVYIVAAITK